MYRVVGQEGGERDTACESQVGIRGADDAVGVETAFERGGREGGGRSEVAGAQFLRRR